MNAIFIWQISKVQDASQRRSFSRIIGLLHLLIGAFNYYAFNTLLLTSSSSANSGSAARLIDQHVAPMLRRYLSVATASPLLESLHLYLGHLTRPALGDIFGNFFIAFLMIFVVPLFQRNSTVDRDSVYQAPLQQHHQPSSSASSSSSSAKQKKTQ